MRRNHTKKDAAGMLVEQPRLGKTGVTALVILCNMLAPLSTDMYMPALPEMRNAFATTDAVMNFTLVGFFLFFALGMLDFSLLLGKGANQSIWDMITQMLRSINPPPLRHT